MVSVFVAGMVIPLAPVSVADVMPMSPPVLDSAPLKATAPPVMVIAPEVAIALAAVMSPVLPALPSVAEVRSAGSVNFCVLSAAVKLAPVGSIVRLPEVMTPTLPAPKAKELPRRVMSPDCPTAPSVFSPASLK